MFVFFAYLLVQVRHKQTADVAYLGGGFSYFFKYFDYCHPRNLGEDDCKHFDVKPYFSSWVGEKPPTIWMFP